MLSEKILLNEEKSVDFCAQSVEFCCKSVDFYTPTQKTTPPYLVASSRCCNFVKAFGKSQVIIFKTNQAI